MVISSYIVERFGGLRGCPPWRRIWRRSARQLRVSEQLPHAAAIHDQRDQAQPAAAVRAGQNIHPKSAPYELSPLSPQMPWHLLRRRMHIRGACFPIGP